MNSHELTQHLDALISVIEDNHFFQGLTILDARFEQFGNAVEKLISAKQDKINQEVNTAKSVLGQAISLEKEKIDIFDFYDDGKKIQDVLRNIRENVFADNEVIFSSLINDIEVCIKLYKQHVRSYSHTSSYSLCKQASVVKAGLISVIDSYTPLRKTLLGEDEENQLVIVFNSICSNHQYSVKIDSFISAYEEICIFCKIPVSENPLVFSKLETGSPWYVKLSGHAMVLAILTTSLEMGSDYVHENYIATNEIGEIPKIASAANEVLKLTQQLKDSGFNVDEQMDELNKLSVKLSKNLNGLVADQANIEINGKEHSVPKAQQQKFLQDTKRLEHKSDTELENQSN